MSISDLLRAPASWSSDRRRGRVDCADFEERLQAILDVLKEGIGFQPQAEAD
jgi:uncharacterized membrane protein